MNRAQHPEQHSGTTYRPDIDGLRAVAVGAVMAFHIGSLHMTGGYVGVDIFFVISGYLISSIIFSEVAAGRFSVLSFYERRIRRIFPALFGLLLIYTAFACFFLLPSECVDFAKTLLATTFSASNFYLWMQSGYFDHRNSNPLLHTWSLAVEEQFYISFPLFLLFVRRFFPKRLRASVLLLAAASLVTSAVVVAKNPDTAFYMPYTRAWELLLGTILALRLFPAIHNALLRNIATLAGMAMILFAAFFYTPTTHFPGLTALLPCCGSALIIGAGISGGSLVYSLLSLRPLVGIGLISYSLYLWHWPVIMLYRMGILDTRAQFERIFGNTFPPDRFDHLVQVIASFALAYLSWKYIELPLRKGRLRTAFPRNHLFAAAGAVALILVAFSSIAIASSGLKARFSRDTLQAASFLDTQELQKDEDAQRLGRCFVDATTGVMRFDYTYCLQNKPGAENYLLLGDSHAAAIWPALQRSLAPANVLQVNVTACTPTRLGHEPGLCRNVMDYVYGSYLPANKPRALVLEADWSAGSVNALDETLQWATLHNLPVIVIGCVPEYDAPLARLIAYSIAWRQPNLPRRHLLAEDGILEQRLRSLVVDKWHFRFLSLYDAICPDGTCAEFADTNHRIPLMDDNHHLNRFGAQFAVSRILRNGRLD